MNPHLALIKTNSTYPLSPQTESLSDMDIILSQALLMEAGSASFKAMKSGEIAKILAGLVALAYHALQALAGQGKDLIDQPPNHQSYHLLAIMRLLSEKITQCSSGKAEDYSRLYYSCSHLATDFLNADFDKAFLVYHEWRKSNDTANTPNNPKPLDLTDYLYE
jgi:hypothetical protein